VSWRAEYQEFTALLREHGPFSPRGIWKGLAPTVVRDSASFFVYFGSYEAFCQSLQQMTSAGDRTAGISFLSGGVAGMLAWFCIYPLDVLKTRWQTGNYSSFIGCLQQGLQSEGGPRFMVQGLGATMLRAAPQHAVTFATYEYVSQLF